MPDRPWPAARGAVTAFLAGRRPVIASHSVCQECKAARHGVPAGRRRDAVPGPGDQGRLRGALSLASTGAALAASDRRQRQHRRSLDATGPARHGRRGGSTLRHLQRRGACFGQAQRHGSARARTFDARESHSHDPRTKRTRMITRRGNLARRRRGFAARARRRTVGHRRGARHLRAARFFEALLSGPARHSEAPDITARICGICPVAYQMSACARSRTPAASSSTKPHRGPARLLYCGEWIQSHALHVYLLHAPDFLGCADAVELAARDRARSWSGASTEANRQPAMMETSGAERSTRSTCASGASTARRTPSDSRPRRAASPGPRRRAGDDRRMGLGLRVPRRVESDYRFVALDGRDGTRSSGGHPRHVRRARAEYGAVR
jgi:hypothetical protein